MQKMNFVFVSMNIFNFTHSKTTDMLVNVIKIIIIVYAPHSTSAG